MDRVSFVALVGVVILAAGCGGSAGSTTAGVSANGTSVPATTVVATQPPVTTSVPGVSTSVAESEGPCLPRFGEPSVEVNVGGAYEPQFIVSDFTGDGLDDALVTWMRFGTADAYEVDLLVNDGGGGLVLATADVIQGDVPQTYGVGQNRTLVADFNGDGRKDVFLPDFGMDAEPFPGAQNVLLLSSEGGKLIDATANLPQLADNPHDAIAADVDGDGDLDIFVVGTWGAPLVDPYLLLNNGEGVFTVGGDLPPDVRLMQNWFVSAAFADVNQDGTPDLVLGSSGDPMGEALSMPGSMVLLNDGAARFTVLAGALPTGPFSDDSIGGQGYYVLPLDLNSDDYPDLIIDFTRYDYTGRMLQVLINNGDGTFRDETESRLPQTINNDVFLGIVQLVDVDGDGALDVLARPFDDRNPEPLVYLNDGTGRFGVVSHEFNIETLYYDFLDLDGDGGLDIVTSVYSSGSSSSVPVSIIRDLGCP